MFGSSWRVARVAGIEIRVDASWTLIALLVGYSLYLRFTTLHPDLAGVRGAILAVAAAALFFASVLLHELAHAIVSTRRGIRVKGITLFLFGGVTEARVESRRAEDELAIAVVGPLTSFALAGVLWAVTALVGPRGAIGGATGYLAWVNLALGAFNLVPGFPLDGGRVLRALLWRATGSYARATQVATRLGRAVGIALIALGVAAVLAGDVGGLWIAAIGWFLLQAANASYAQLQVQRVLRGVEAGDVMTRDLVTLPPELALDVAVDRYFLRVDHSAFPVVGADGTLLGLLRLAAVRGTPAGDRASLRVADVMAPLDRVPVVGPHEPLDRVLDRFQEGEVHRVLVVDATGSLAGMVTPRDVSRFLQRSTDLGLRR